MVPPPRIELRMTGYQPIVIPFNYRGIIGTPGEIRTHGFADLQSTALGRSATGAYNLIRDTVVVV